MISPCSASRGRPSISKELVKPGSSGWFVTTAAERTPASAVTRSMSERLNPLTSVQLGQFEKSRG